MMAQILCTAFMDNLKKNCRKNHGLNLGKIQTQLGQKLNLFEFSIDT